MTSPGRKPALSAGLPATTTETTGPVADSGRAKRARVSEFATENVIPRQVKSGSMFTPRAGAGRSPGTTSKSSDWPSRTIESGTALPIPDIATRRTSSSALATGLLSKRRIASPSLSPARWAGDSGSTDEMTILALARPPIRGRFRS